MMSATFLQIRTGEIKLQFSKRKKFIDRSSNFLMNDLVTCPFLPVMAMLFGLFKYEIIIGIS